MLDVPTLLYVAENLMARVQAERIMRDNARRSGDKQAADAHGDRAQAYLEAASAIPWLVEKPITT